MHHIADYDEGTQLTLQSKLKRICEDSYTVKVLLDYGSKLDWIYPAKIISIGAHTVLISHGENEITEVVHSALCWIDYNDSFIQFKLF